MKIFINDTEYSFEKGQTILDVARQNDLYIPTLCYLKNITQKHSCNMCLVQVEGKRNLLRSCNTLAQDGMKVYLDTERVFKRRKKILENLLNKHNLNCGDCVKQGCCAFQKMWITNKAKKSIFETGPDIDDSSLSITRDYNKCVFCGRCVEVCSKQQQTHALEKVSTNNGEKIQCNDGKLFKDSHCIGCGQCILVCPVASLCETDGITKTNEFLEDPTCKVVAQIAPAVRVSFGEEFKKEYGYFDEERLAGVLKALGFDYVYDVVTGADFTAIEESKELLERLQNNVHLPQFTSCCPAWVRYVEEYYPEYMDNLSMCRSPNEMLASVVKNHCHKNENIKIVAVMPCTAKKEEISRFNSVDAVITTRELARMVRAKGINYDEVELSKFDNPLADYSGGGLIFGTTGGVTESVLRCVSHQINKTEDIDLQQVRTTKGLKEIEVTIGETHLSVAVVNGIGNANKVMQNIKQGKHYDFIEVMACPGGCVGGGGQPIVDRDRVDYEQVLAKRASALYTKEKTLSAKSALSNPAVLKVYDEFFNPNPDQIQKLLHKPHKND